MTKEDFLAGKRFLYEMGWFHYEPSQQAGYVIDVFGECKFYCDHIDDTGFELFHNLFGITKFKFSDCKTSISS